MLNTNIKTLLPKNTSIFAIYSVSLFFGLYFLIVPGLLYAQEDTETSSTEQDEAFDMVLVDAEERYTAGDYEEAAALYEIAFELRGQPEHLYKIARCYELLAYHKEALLRYETFLDCPGATGDLRTNALSSVVALKQKISDVPEFDLWADTGVGDTDTSDETSAEEPPINKNATDETAIDETTTGESEAVEGITKEPDETVNDSTQTEEVQQPIVANAPPTEPKSPAPVSSSSDSHRLKKILGWSFVGTGSALTLVGFISGGLAAASKSDYEDAGQSSARIEYREDMKRRALIFDITFFSGVAFAATGVSLLIVRSLRMRSEQQLPAKTGQKSQQRSEYAWYPTPSVYVGNKEFAVGISGQF